jgi:two-component system, OmpR family, response regulator
MAMVGVYLDRPPRTDGGHAIDTTDVDDVPFVRWPAEAAYREALARAGRARLLLVAAPHDPPLGGDALEDWVREGADPVEAYSRRELLRARQSRRAPVVLDDGLVRRGSRWAAVPPVELRVLVPLLNRAGSLVTRVELLAAARPGAVADPTRTLDRVVRRVRSRLAPLGIRVHTVRATGFLLDVGTLPD